MLDRRNISSLLLACSVLAIAPCAAEDLPQFQIDCELVQAKSLDCEYRVTPPTEVVRVTASIAGLEVTDVVLATRADTVSTAILFVMDTGNPQRSSTAISSLQHLRQFLESTSSNMNLGLATVGRELRVHSPLGSPLVELHEASRNLPSRGQSPNLLASLSDALTLLERHSAKTKLLYILSDGIVGMRAESLEALLQRASSSNVLVSTVGYPRTSSLSSGLNALRDLSEKSGGIFEAASTGGGLKASFISAPFAFIHTGGRISLLLPTEDAGRARDVEIWLETPQRTINTVATVRGVAASSEPAGEANIPAPARTDEPAKPAAVMVDSDAPDTPAESWPTAKSLGLAALGIVVAALVGWRLRRRNLDAPSPPPTNEIPHAEPTPVAPVAHRIGVLEVPGKESARHLIVGDKITVGRTSASNIIIDDPSVSRKHAEIVRTEHGNFKIFDLESMNGLFVNSRRRRRATLAEGDKVELGDAVLYFSYYEEEEEEAEPDQQDNDNAETGTLVLQPDFDVLEDELEDHEEEPTQFRPSSR